MSHVGFLLSVPSQLINVIKDLLADQITNPVESLSLLETELEMVNVQQQMGLFERHENASAVGSPHANQGELPPA